MSETLCVFAPSAGKFYWWNRWTWLFVIAPLREWSWSSSSAGESKEQVMRQERQCEVSCRSCNELHCHCWIWQKVHQAPWYSFKKSCMLLQWKSCRRFATLLRSQKPAVVLQVLAKNHTVVILSTHHFPSSHFFKSSREPVLEFFTFWWDRE